MLPQHSKIGCDDVVGPEGMEKFCEDIGVEPENVSKICLLIVALTTSLAVWLHLYIVGGLACQCLSHAACQAELLMLTLW